jgi:wobble nucleotide-excising tRNase
MLRRFQLISGVGCFSACRPPQVQFEPMSLVYGENCYGKSTLCDILRSLGENAPDLITERITVPASGDGTQYIQASLAMPGQAQETVFTFRSGAWSPALPDTLRFDVFDTDFIHRNIFTGLSIERPNHENITRFVLGDRGVRTAQRIADINSETRALSKSLRNTEANVFAGLPDIPMFLAMTVQQDIATIERDIATLVATVETEIRLSGGLEAARSRPEPTVYSQPTAINGVVERVEAMLSGTFDRTHREAEMQLQEHLTRHTQDPGLGRHWVRKGTALIRNGDCPFCGQKIIGDAAALIAAYQAVFNDAFERFMCDTLTGLDEAKRQFSAAACSDLPVLLQQNSRALLAYPELRAAQDMQHDFEAADAASVDVMRRYL